MSVSRRGFLAAAATTLAVTRIGELSAKASNVVPDVSQDDKVDLPQLHASTEVPEKIPGPFRKPSERVGYAIVGLGRLSLGQILPCFGKTKYSKPVALVSGDRKKALKIADQYGIAEASIYDYQGFESLAHNRDVQVIYIVLPNSMHAEYVIRGAKLGKHILCEKPMATSVKDCQNMISACNEANVKLMIAYRQQYEPMNRAIVSMVQSGKLGALKSIVASNSQNQGDPNQWRQKVALSGGGCLPDVGIYCLNAARFLSGSEPVEVFGVTHQPTDDVRFKEVEETCSFTLRFPNGLIASCSSGYGAHRSQFLRLEGDMGWAELNPAFAYSGLRLRTNRTEDGHDTSSEPSIESVDQFAQEIDHMSLCVIENRKPHTPGEEGLQDQRIIEAIYQSAKTGQKVKVPEPTAPPRSAEPLTE
jgi:predicted dehydrogenase